MGATNPNAGGAPGGGGKGGMGMNRGPLGNAQNNPGAPQANYGMGMKPGMGAWANMMQTYPSSGPTASNWGSRNPAGVPEWASAQGLTPINQAFSTPQPQEPIGGYIGGQPAQFHYQAQALGNPQPQRKISGPPAGGLEAGILAKLFGG